jgi:hypothetical protein
MQDALRATSVTNLLTLFMKSQLRSKAHGISQCVVRSRSVYVLRSSD